MHMDDDDDDGNGDYYGSAEIVNTETLKVYIIHSFSISNTCKYFIRTHLPIDCLTCESAIFENVISKLTRSAIRTWSFVTSVHTDFFLLVQSAARTKLKTQTFIGLLSVVVLRYY